MESDRNAVSHVYTRTHVRTRAGVRGAIGRAGGVSNKLTADISVVYPAPLPSGSTSRVPRERAGPWEEPRRGVRRGQHPTSAPARERDHFCHVFANWIINTAKYIRERAACSAFTQLALGADWSRRSRGDGDIHSPSRSPPRRQAALDLLCTRTRARDLDARARRYSWRRGTRPYTPLHCLCAPRISLSLSLFPFISSLDSLSLFFFLFLQQERRVVAFGWSESVSLGPLLRLFPLWSLLSSFLYFSLSLMTLFFLSFYFSFWILFFYYFVTSIPSIIFFYTSIWFLCFYLIIFFIIMLYTKDFFTRIQ